MKLSEMIILQLYCNQQLMLFYKFNFSNEKKSISLSYTRGYTRCY